jgi:hypothetical protein
MRPRVRPVAATVALVVLGPLAALGSRAVAAPSPTPSPAIRPMALHVPGLHLAAPRSDADETSTNWSGYIVEPSPPVTGVSMSFVQPAYGSVPPGFAAIWTGIGGDISSDLIQAGTAVNPPGFGQTYYAWVELLPAAEGQILNCAGDRSCTVRPGDHISLRIRQLAARRWLVTLSDRGHWFWQLPLTYTSSRNSAEWIVEAPSLGAPLVGSTQTTLDGLGEVPVSGATFTVSGHARPIALGQPLSVDLMGVEATPSPLSSSGSAFNDCAYSLSCPAP